MSKCQKYYYVMYPILWEVSAVVFFELKGDEGTALELCKRHTKKEQIMEISSIEVYTWVDSQVV